MADAAHARRTAERFVARAGAQRHDLRARLRRALPGRAGGAVRGGRAARAADRERARRSRTATCGPTSRSRRTRRYERAAALRERWHGRGRLRYAVTPRFSVSCTEAMLDACRALLDEAPRAFTSHINESPGEIDFVRELFPEARDYLDTYERAGLLGEVLGARATTCTSPTTSWTGWRRRGRRSRTARRRNAFLARASSRWRATSSTACASGWAPTSAPAPG